MRATPKTFRCIFSALLTALAFGAYSAEAGVITYVTKPGETVPDGSVSSKAEFTVGNGTITIVLSSLEANPTSDGQTVSGLRFSISGLTGNGSLTSVNSGLITTINANGTYSAGTADPLTRWQASHTSDDVVLSTLTGGQPNRLIIGPDDNGGFNPATGEYSNANPSIRNHGPSVLGSATFVITVAGVTENSVLSDVFFQFGTANDPYVLRPGQPSGAVPEPSSLAMGAAAAVIGLAAMRRRRVV